MIKLFGMHLNQSLRKPKELLLLLGVLRFVNHGCNPENNVRFVQKNNRQEVEVRKTKLPKFIFDIKIQILIYS